MTGIVKNLETKGLVARHPSPDHARVMLVSLTETGVTKATQPTNWRGTWNPRYVKRCPATIINSFCCCSNVQST
jgi:DNA-binding MarR family transcriptional regulator